MKNKKTSNSFFLKLIASFTIFMTVGIFTLVSNLETVSPTNVDQNNICSTNIDSTNADSTDTNSTNVDSTDVDSTNVDSTGVDSTNVDSTGVDSTNVDSTDVDSIDVDSTDVDSKPSIVLQQGIVNEVKAGDEFSVSLPVTSLSSASIISEVYAWFTSVCAEDILTLKAVKFIDTSYEVGGGPSYQVITVKAIGPGSCDLTFNYSLLFGDIDSVKETIVYNIKVLPEEVVPTDGVILDDQKVNEVHIGDVIIVKLPSNPSTGYMWCYGSSDPSALRLISSNYVAPDSSAPGAQGTQIFTFRAMHRSSVELTFRYRPAEGMANNTETAIYDVFIEPSLSHYLR